MKKTVLVDFYNLHLRPAFFEGMGFPFPDSNEVMRIVEFFKIYQPDVLKKLTEERKREIADSLIIHESVDSNNIQVIQIADNIQLMQNKEIYFDSQTTLEGYEIRHKFEGKFKSWFMGDVQGFIEEYHFIKGLIDSREVTNRDWNLLEARKGMYKIEIVKMELVMGGDKNHSFGSDYRLPFDTTDFHLGIYFGDLFPRIYDEAISMLKGDLQIQRCQRNGCDNIILKKWNRQYCDTCRHIAKNEVSNKNKRKIAKRIHVKLCALIDKWLPQKGEEFIDAASLMLRLRNISDLKKGKYVFLQSARSMGRYLNRQEVRDMLKAKGIGIEVVDKNKKGATYKLKRIHDKGEMIHP